MKIGEKINYGNQDGNIILSKNLGGNELSKMFLVFYLIFQSKLYGPTKTLGKEME